jgi:uncharacterized protein
VGLKIAGSVVEAAVQAGANQVSGPTLSKEDSDALYDKALKAAVDDASKRAETLADAAGVHVGAVISIQEGETYSPVPMYDRAAASPEQAPIEPGQQDIEATVTVTFAIS